MRFFVVTLALLFAAVFAVEAATEGPATFTSEEVKDSNGRVFEIVRMTGITYKIPIEYSPTIGKTTVVLHIRWPSLSGVNKPLPNDIHRSGNDVIIAMLEPPRVPTLRDSYEALGRHIKEIKPSVAYPGLMQSYYNGKPGPDLISSAEKPRTPSGNPFLFSAPLKNDPGSLCCDTTIALPKGNSLRVRFYAKHLEEWHKIYPAVIRLVNSLEQKG